MHNRMSWLNLTVLALMLATSSLGALLPAQAVAPVAADAKSRPRNPSNSPAPTATDAAAALGNPKATRNGRYSELLAKINCAEDRLDFGRYHPLGFEIAAKEKYCGEKVPARGYWVYVYPDWYVWGKENLEIVGMGLTTRQVKLAHGILSLEMAYLKKDKDWGEAMLGMTAKAIQDLEKYSGKAYPGANPYRIEEDPRLHLSDRIGLASAQSMLLAKPKYSSPWTALHESVHIWNAPVEQAWVCEGLADTVSWLIMEQNHFAFDDDETIGYYMKEWKPVMGQRKDGPLPTRYDHLPQGKAMYFWLMLYQLYGPEFLRQVFGASLNKYNFGAKDLANMLKKVEKRDLTPLFSGWLQEGAYQVRRPSDFGPVKYPLPEPVEY